MLVLADQASQDIWLNKVYMLVMMLDKRQINKKIQNIVCVNSMKYAM